MFFSTKINVSMFVMVLFCLCWQTAKNQEVDSLNNQLRHTFYQYRLVYPDEAIEAGIEGDIILKFDISLDCKIINLRQDTVFEHGTERTIKESLDLLQKEWEGRNHGNCEEIKNVEVMVNFRLR